MKNLKSIIFYTIITSALSYAQISIDTESGMAFTGYNDVQIPRETGTRFSLYNQIKTDPSIFFRARLNYTINNKHVISALYAPFSLYGSGIIEQSLKFESVTFPANDTLQSTYMFNSYRLTYRYDFVETDKIKFGLGFTAKIRDAAITLKSKDTTSTKTNVGFVPIINFNLEYRPAHNLSVVLNGDALAAPQGRAEDVMLALQYRFNRHVDFKVGYRILEGGADVAEVYNFSLFHYALAGLILNF
ncbi:MAG: hypothetical protein KGZ86_01760 [Candidatus Latescibacteria bacterium]|nr:hypothetical protein [Candidatus Latescibacterota bacterium]